MFPIYVGIAVDASERSKMVKRKGSSTSRPRARKKAAKGRSKAKTSERGAEDECAQLRREIPALQGKRAELSEKQSKLENQKRQLEELKRKLEELKREQIKDIKQIRRLKEVMPKGIAGTRKLGEQLQRLRREEEQIQMNLLQKSNRLKEVCSAREAENTQRLLEKLPQEVWGKILDNLEENDLFPLALSCRYFREKQVELVAQTGQNGKPRCALKTTVRDVWKTFTGQPMSAECLRFCYKESEIALHGAKWIMELAAYHGHLTLLQELEKEVELDSEVFSFACAGGNLEIMKWLRSEGCPWNASACNGAAWGGHLEILKWLRSKGCPWDWRSCSRAAGGGHLETLKWLRSEGCPWNQYACSGAAWGGHLEVLKWLRSEGCPWDKCMLKGSSGRSL